MNTIWFLPHVILLPDFNTQPLNGETREEIREKHGVEAETLGPYDPDNKCWPVVIGGNADAVSTYLRHLRSTWPLNA